MYYGRVCYMIKAQDKNRDGDNIYLLYLKKKNIIK